MSGEDPHVESLTQYCYDNIIKSERIIGIMVLRRDSANEDLENKNLRNGIINYYIDKHSDLPDLLLRICKKARGIE